MKILLVTSPHLDHSVYHQSHDCSNSPAQLRYAQTFVPMGLLSLAGAIKSAADVEVTIADINKVINSGTLPMRQDFYAATAAWLLSYDPDFIGFMTECDSYHHLLRICQSLKAQKPAVRTLLGGTHATAAHFETLSDFSSIDFIIRGEGERAFRSFIETMAGDGDLRSVGNLTYRDGGHIVSNPELPLIDDLDTLPWPDFSRIVLDPQDDLWVEIGRGCPFKCNFCFTAPYWKRKHRIKSPARIISELVYLKSSYGRTDFNFTHDLFTTDRRWVINFCRQLADSGLEVTWTCSSRTDTLDEEQISWLQRAGCRNIYFGVETGTAEMQKKIDKNLDLDFADQIIRKTKEAGIDVTVGFISGFPGESAVSLSGTLKKAYSSLRLPDSTVHIFGYSPYRGSSSFEKIKSNLVFDQHFADFPLSERIHLQNCELMANHFEIFSRYSRMNSYEGLDVEVIRAAEEYFPIINTLRSLMLVLDEKGIDPLAILTAWTRWIASTNQQRGKVTSRLYYGTIEDFLVFLEPHIQQYSLLDSITAEMIRWELLKDRFRSKSYDPPVVMQNNTSTEYALYTNPSTMIADFEHANVFLSGAEGSEPGTFAFYARCDGTPEIVRLQPIAYLVLDLARQGVTPTELLDVINGLVEDIAKPSSPAREALSDLLKQLEQMELLIPYPKSPLDHFFNRRGQVKEILTLDSLQESLRPPREQLVGHKVYHHIETLADMRILMEHHVFAVWDFMSLLKALQRHLTCVTVPWVPQGNRRSRRLINEIVLAEESDEESGGGYISHFELYRAAMDQCGADTSRIDGFLDRIRRGEDVVEALEKAGVPKAAQTFVRTTWRIVESGSAHEIVAAFTLGREDVIPDMFRALVTDLLNRFPVELTLFHDYLERHIHLDEERHAPMALQMLLGVCNTDHRKWREAEEVARVALDARIALWDGVVEQILDAPLRLLPGWGSTTRSIRPDVPKVHLTAPRLHSAG